MDNIGAVIYSKTNNGLEAEWILKLNNEVQSGTGLAKKLSKNERFEGVYEIIYKNANGNISPKIELNIKAIETYFELKWLIENQVIDEGIGLLIDEKLCAGWKKTKI